MKDSSASSVYKKYIKKNVIDIDSFGELLI